MKNFLLNIPRPFDGNMISRVEECKICNEKIGKQIAEVDYWNIRTSKIVKCPKCNHMQLDPMLNETESTLGCFAYYVEEALRTSTSEVLKNYIRNFRRGVVFGYSLKKKNIFPKTVLELGPGSGYFTAGLQFVFNDIDVTVMDINQEILDFNRNHHGFKPLLATPDELAKENIGKFDLVLARDLLEHVSDISKVIQNVNLYLQPNGYFHFITPNGHEDIWKHYLTFSLTKSHSELLINHVNYFDGQGLKNLLLQKGFLSIEYYTYQFKTTIRGRGWKLNKKLMSPISQKTNAALLINEKAQDAPQINLSKKDILAKWYIIPNAKWITFIYSFYHHFLFLRAKPELNIGHEIFGLYKKELISQSISDSE